MGIVSEPTKFERIHQLLRYTLSSSSVAIWVWSSFANLSISRITSSVRPNSSSLSEPCITDKPIVNVLVFSFYALLLKLICRMVFFTTTFLPVPVTVWPALPNVKVRDRERIQHGLDILLVFCCIISQEVPARAADDANVPIRQTCSALCFWLHIDYLALFSVPSSFDRIL